MKRILYILFIVTSFFFLSPTAHAQGNQTVFAGTTTTAVTFPGTGCTYNWVNNNPAIGLAASGTGNIPSFTAINTGNSPVTATITATPTTLGGFAYISNTTSNSVSVIDIITNKVVATIPVGSEPLGVSVNADGTKVYVANEDYAEINKSSVSVINTADNTVTSIPTGGDVASALSVSPDGSRVYVAVMESNEVDVINTLTNVIVATIPVSVNPDGVSVSPDGNWVYVISANAGIVSVISTTTNTVVSTIQVGPNALGVSVSSDGTKVYVANFSSNDVSVINTTTNAVVATIPVGTSPAGVSINPDNSRVYVTNKLDGTVSIINTLTNSVVAVISVGLYPVGISVSPDGSQLYVANNGDNTVSVINTTTNAVTSVVSVGSNPSAFGNFISGCKVVKFTITVNPTPTVPTITASPATGTISACAGTASTSPNIQQFTVSGGDLSADIVATAPNNFEVSLSAASGFGNSVTLPLSGSAVNNTVVYVRSAASAIPPGISGNVTLISGAANSKVPVTGTINAPPVVNPVSGQTFVNGIATTVIGITGTGDTYSWTNDTPGIGLPGSGTGDIPSFTPVNNGSGPVVANITVTPNSGTACSGTPVTFTITVNPVSFPTITTTGTPAPLTTIYGTPSTSTTFTVSVSNLTAGVLVTPPTGFEVSTDGINYSATITVAVVGTIGPLYPSGTVYIRLASSTPVGDYSGNIVLSSTGAANVNVEMPVSNVIPAPLTITADNKSNALGEANPVLTVTYSGFVNSDGPAQLTTQPAITTTALTTSPAGQYPVTATGAADPNYIITYIPGVLTINPQPQTITVPNAFTPNGDGVNDTWDIKYLNTFPNCTVAVFNRWGQNVYSSDGYGTPWDGSYKGTVLPTGTYYYLINLRNGLNVLSGYVAIIR